MKVVLRDYLFSELFLVFVFLFFINGSLSSQKSVPETNEFTIYVMPSLYPLNWHSPSLLFKSVKDCYFKTIGTKDNYLLGHIAVELNSHLLAEPLLIAQTSSSTQEKLDLVFKQKAGLAIMGAPMHGRLETTGELRHKLDVYAKRNKLAFIRYRISDDAARRMLKFISEYSKKMDGQNAPCDFYGGAFWPRYQQEGSGCSAFGMALLEVVNLLPDSDSRRWRVDVNLPMNLIGGEYNQGKRIKTSAIIKAHKWFTDNGKVNVDYVKHSVYEPSIIFDWIREKRQKTDHDYKIIDDKGVPGLFVDATNTRFDPNEPLFLTRLESNIFIDNYLKKIRNYKAEIK
jgi:hypothetical protein